MVKKTPFLSVIRNNRACGTCQTRDVEGLGAGESIQYVYISQLEYILFQAWSQDLGHSIYKDVMERPRFVVKKRVVTEFVLRDQ
jgi:hypothetical protein